MSPLCTISEPLRTRRLRQNVWTSWLVSTNMEPSDDWPPPRRQRREDSGSWRTCWVPSRGLQILGRTARAALLLEVDARRPCPRRLENQEPCRHLFMMIQAPPRRPFSLKVLRGLPSNANVGVARSTSKFDLHPEALRSWHRTCNLR